MSNERRCPEGFEPCDAWVHHGVCHGGYHRQEPDDERLDWTPSDPTSAINAALLLIQKQSMQLHRIADHTATIAAALERLAFPPVITGHWGDEGRSNQPLDIGPERIVINPETPEAWKRGCRCGKPDQPPERHRAFCPRNPRYGAWRNTVPTDIPGHEPGRFEFARAADGTVWIHDHHDRKRYPLDPERSEEI